MMDADVSQRNPIFFILGATGTGKSLAAVKVARSLLDRCGFRDVAVVNCDVMQFYIDLPIATNKVSLAEMEGIPHFFMGFLSSAGLKVRDPAIPYRGSDQEGQETLSDFGEGKAYHIHSYVRDVVEFIDAFFLNHPLGAVVVCGGTCYYAQALMFKNVLTEEDGDYSVSSELDFLLCEDTKEGNNLWQELNQVDPVVAARYHPNDFRRVARLLEIYKRTKRLPSEIFASRPNPCFRYPPSKCFILWTNVAYEKLKRTLDERVEKMVTKGIVDEFLKLAKRQVEKGFDVAIAKAIGFKEFISVVDTEGGELRLKGADELRKSIELLKTNTKRYARQQKQWIKNRFLGRFWSAFTLQLDARNFVCIDGSKQTSEFIRDVEIVTEFLIKPGLQPISGVSFPLMEEMEQAFEVRQEWCPVCELFFCGGSQRKVHLSSKRHRRAVKHAALLKEQQEKYACDISSPFLLRKTKKIRK